ncbi:MAG: TerC family protein [Planctomycetota bacterium]
MFELLAASETVAGSYELFSTAALVSLLTLTLLEVVLGIDNVVFIAILTGKLPESQRKKAWYIGLGLAMLMRIALLFAATWVLSLDKTALFTIPMPEFLADVFGKLFNGAADTAHATPHGPLGITGKELILFLGGAFLVGKASFEIHDKLEGHAHGPSAGKAVASFGAIIVQILLLDAVFSVDSVITAVGIAQHIEVMVIAVVIAVIVMITFAQPISRFVEKHPSMKLLALAFLILIGVMLLVEAFEVHVPKGYIYFAMAFAFTLEMLNIRIRGKKGKAVTLHQSYVESDSPDGYGDIANPNQLRLFTKGE